ncbi:hypothetical protein [Desulfonatronospira sp.]|uniref:hypothetical protein n=1 Tax=Desulfonatronospira sp. TaxID=1962951 RepID=UPI0025C4C04F|nr:hypothetical protein [Desulfonatronospira sp.]
MSASTATINLSSHQGKVERACNNFDGTGSVFRASLVLFFFMPVLLFFDWLVFRRVRRQMEACPSGQAVQFMAEINQEAGKIHSCLARLKQAVPGSIFFAHIRGLVDRRLDDWEDLVEDTAMGADEQFRGLVKQIAGRL